MLMLLLLVFFFKNIQQLHCGGHADTLGCLSSAPAAAAAAAIPTNTN
jgi:hypothetical protein